MLHCLIYKSNSTAKEIVSFNKNRTNKTIPIAKLKIINLSGVRNQDREQRSDIRYASDHTATILQ